MTCIVEVATDGLHLREGPGARFPWKDKLERGTRLAAENPVNGWSRVTVLNPGPGRASEGYVDWGYVKVVYAGIPSPAHMPPPRSTRHPKPKRWEASTVAGTVVTVSVLALIVLLVIAYIRL
jgi:hypothetical protein